jgi:hypothetical protein
MPITPTPKIYGAAGNMWCIQVMPPTAATNAETEPSAGHALGWTK